MKKKWIKRLHLDVSIKWFDIWFGFFVDVPGKALYFCPLPMLVLKFWFTEHKVCVCGSPMEKIAIDTGDGWSLNWECKSCDEIEDLDWPFGDEFLSARQLKRRGFEVV